MRYLITVPAPARRLTPTTFATESTFVHHVRDLKRELGARFDEIVLAMPYMDDAAWQEQRAVCEVVDEAQEGIRLELMHRHGCGKLAFLATCPRLLPQIARLASRADVVHTHFSYDLYRAIGAWFWLFAVLFGRRVIAVEDIDRRRDAEMNYRTGRWTWPQYAICRYIYDPLRSLLMRAYVHTVDLMLFKEAQQVRDYGRGKSHVRHFLDPHFTAAHVVDDAFVAQRQRELADRERPLRLLYFGRLVAYKGVDRMLDAVAVAHRRGARVTFDIMGCGDRAPLRAQAERLGIAHLVRFREPCAYGPEFFGVLRQHDVLLACPLSNDTPRSAWDALASGMAIVAFATPFYGGMATYSQAVEVTPWPQVEPLGAKLAELAADKERLVPLVRSAVATARANTGDIWLRRRAQWVDELFPGPLVVPQVRADASEVTVPKEAPAAESGVARELVHGSR